MIINEEERPIIETLFNLYVTGKYSFEKIADILYKKGYKLYYYKNETTRRELDFIIQKDGEVIPVEVKSGKAKATSLEKVISHNEEIKKAYKLHDGNTEVDGKVISLPLYMGIFL